MNHAQPDRTLIGLNPDEPHDNPFVVSRDRSDGSCNTDQDPFGRICVPNEIEDFN